MKKVKLKQLLKRNRNVIEIIPNETYKQVKVRLWSKGVLERNEVKGSMIKSNKRFLVKPNQFIISKIDARNGAYGLIPKELDNAIVTSDFLTYNLNKDKITPEFFMILTQNPDFLHSCQQASFGTTNRIRLNEDKFLEIAIPLPDIKTQKQVLSKINKVENEIKQLETNISHDKTLLSKLKQSILSEAVQGKLVPQNPKDESASELLKKIKKEKEKLIKEGKIKKAKELPDISEDEVPYDLPEGWVWVRLGDVCEKIHYGYTASALKNSNGIRLLRITDIQNHKVNWEQVPSCQIKESEIDKYLLNENDILIARTGGTIGKSYLVKDAKFKSVFASYLIRAVPLKQINPDYIKLFLGSKLYWGQLFEGSMGTGQPNVNGVTLSKLRFPLPPLSEQKRIVEKVDSLMGFCDELENKIKENSKNSKVLMDSVLKKVFST